MFFRTISCALELNIFHRRIGLGILYDIQIIFTRRRFHQ